MKNLTLLNDNTNIKLNDTGTVIQFKASNEGQPIGLSNGQSAIFRIKNELGFLKSVNANSSYGGYVFELDTEDLKSLVPDTYQVELLIQVDSDNALIFPDKGFVQFTINENALNITGEQLPVMSLEDFKDELKTYVDNQTTQATSNIKNDFDTYVDNLTDSTIATATKASQDAQTAIDTANTAKSTADTAKSTADAANNKANANASLITANNTLIQTNTNSINNGLYLDRAKSYAQINSSKNLVVNSEMQDKESNTDPYTDWKSAWGWYWTNTGNNVGRKNWYGYNALQLGSLNTTCSTISTGLCAGNITKATTYSVRFHYRKNGNFTTEQIISVYLEYAYQSDFVGSQKVLIGEVTSSSNFEDFITKENITVPQHYDWIRLRIESNLEATGSYIWFAQPMINYGSTIQDYVISDMPGQRIADIENQLASIQQAQSVMLTQMATIQSSINNEGSGS